MDCGEQIDEQPCSPLNGWNPLCLKESLGGTYRPKVDVNTNVTFFGTRGRKV